jgi:hypothetical protein
MVDENRPFWSVRHDNELWFGGKLILVIETRPDYTLQQKRLFAYRLEMLLNTAHLTPDGMLRVGL